MTTLTTVDDDRAAVLSVAEDAGRVDEAFRERFDAQLPALHAALREQGDGLEQLTRLVVAASAAWNARPLELKVRDGQRAADPDWFQSPRMLAVTCFADRYAGNLAGVRDQIGYLRDLGLTLLHLQPLFDASRDENGRPRVDPRIGSTAQLRDLAADLRTSGIALALDLPPGDDPVADLLFLANLGVDVVRVDAAKMDAANVDAASSLPKRRVLRAVAALAAPGVLLAGAAGDDGDADLVTDANAALIWEALATRDARLLQRTIDRRPTPPADATWLTHVRDADALSWTFDDEDTGALGIDPTEHRRFLARFYTGRFDGSFARGLSVAGEDAGADDGGTDGGDGTAVAGTTASLAGIEAGDAAGEDRVVLAHAIALAIGGIPVLYLGDEVAQLNDHSFADDPERRDDARWVHRGNRPRDQYARRGDADTAAGRVHRRLTKLISVRQSTAEFAGGALTGFRVPLPAVVGFQRVGDDSVVLVLANVGDEAAEVDALTLSGFERTAVDLVHGTEIDLDEGVQLAPHGFVWLRVSPV